MRPEDIIAPAVSAGVAVIAALVTLVGARRLGLTDLQRAVDTETDRLITALRARVEVLEKENGALKAHVDRLEQQVERLETAIVEKATGRRRGAV